MKQLLVLIITCILILPACDKANGKKTAIKQYESKLNDSLILQLDFILEDDQKPREEAMDLIDKYGNGSKEASALVGTMGQNDYFNLIKIKAILDKYGWIGPDVIGTQGSTTIFLVIQHADIETQKKYLPMMTKAVIEGKASCKQWALLEDRVGLKQTGTQTYGSQIDIDPVTGKNSIAPIKDEINVNKRRKMVGLQPLEEYAKYFGIDYKLPTK